MCSLFFHYVFGLWAEFGCPFNYCYYYDILMTLFSTSKCIIYKGQRVQIYATSTQLGIGRTHAKISMEVKKFMRDGVTINIKFPQNLLLVATTYFKSNNYLIRMPNLTCNCNLFLQINAPARALVLVLV